MLYRYVEIFKSTLDEARAAIAAQGKAPPTRPGPYDRPSRGMRGRGASVTPRGRGGSNIKGVMGKLNSYQHSSTTQVFIPSERSKLQ